MFLGRVSTDAIQQLHILSAWILGKMLDLGKDNYKSV